MAHLTPPDRFARVVERDYQRNHINDGLDGQVWTKETAALLRAEHRAVVRLVNEELAYRVERNCDPNEVTDVSGVSACKSLLAALARRAR